MPFDLLWSITAVPLFVLVVIVLSVILWRDYFET
jgi:hypothetical protein